MAQTRFILFAILLSWSLTGNAQAGERHACALFSKAELDQAAGTTVGEPKANDLPAENGVTLSNCSWQGAPGGATRRLTVMLRIAPQPVPDTESKVRDVMKDGGAPVTETQVGEQRALWSSRTTPLGVNGELHVFKNSGAVYLMIAVLGTGDDRALQERAKALAALAVSRAGP